MGKVYKNLTPSTQPPTPTPTVVQQPVYSIPDPIVLPAEEFTPTLQKAMTLCANQLYREALPHLLNLEVTDFNNIEVHELLADVFLHLNHLSLAKEQCQIYAQLLQNQTSNPIPMLKSFDELVDEAGNFEELQKEFDEFQKGEVSIDNFYHGTNIALKLATHYMANGQYKQAEDLLTKHRDQYISFLDNED